MRRRYAVILFLFLLGVVAALGQVGLLSLPFDFAVSLKILMPESLRRFTATESRRSSASPSASESNLAASTAGEEKPKAEAAKSADPGVKLGPGIALDIARISPNGASVFAGRTTPFAIVTVRENATAVATTTANAAGDWSLVTEHKFASANPQINLSIGDGVRNKDVRCSGSARQHFSSVETGSACSHGVPVSPAFERVRGRGGDRA